jgi:predicted deacylase
VEAPALESVLWELSSQKGEVADFIDAGGALVFIPVVNPDGYARQDRYNAEGLDLNRHWNESEQSKETRAWKKGLDGLSEGAPSFRYVYSIDYHCCRSVALIPETVERDLSHQPRVEKLRAFFKKVFRIPVGNTENLLGYASQGTLKDYLWEKFGTLSVTYEGTAYHEPKQWNLHKRLWKKLMAESLDAFKQKDQAKVPALVRN